MHIIRLVLGKLNVTYITRYKSFLKITTLCTQVPSNLLMIEICILLSIKIEVFRVILQPWIMDLCENSLNGDPNKT